MLSPVKAKTMDIPIEGSVRRFRAASGASPIMRLPDVKSRSTQNNTLWVDLL
jgi:hypothetical protein